MFSNIETYINQYKILPLRINIVRKLKKLVINWVVTKIILIITLSQRESEQSQQNQAITVT